MAKWKILILLMIAMIPIVIGLDMCKDTVNIKSNCTMVTPVISCTLYNYSIYNLSGSEVEQNDLTQLNDSVYYFNFTLSTGNYIIKLCDGTTREVYVEPSEDNNMIVGILILSPLIFAFLIMFIAYSLGQVHVVMKWFLMMLSMVFIFVTWHFGTIGLIEFYGMSELQDAIGGTVYWFSIVFGVIVTYFIIYFIVAMFNSMAQRKKERLEY